MGSLVEHLSSLPISRLSAEVMVYSLFYSINALYYESDLQAMSWVLLCFSAILPLLVLHSDAVSIQVTMLCACVALAIPQHAIESSEIFQSLSDMIAIAESANL